MIEAVRGNRVKHGPDRDQFLATLVREGTRANTGNPMVKTEIGNLLLPGSVNTARKTRGSIWRATQGTHRNRYRGLYLSQARLGRPVNVAIRLK